MQSQNSGIMQLDIGYIHEFFRISFFYCSGCLCFFINKSRKSNICFQGLKANVLQQFEENAKQALQDQNQDSSDRLRSGSYSEAALRRY